MMMEVELSEIHLFVDGGRSVGISTMVGYNKIVLLQ
jgi:hypothetical protein